MRTNLAVVLIIGSLLGAATAYKFLSPSEPGSQGRFTEGQVAIGGPFSLVDQTGARVSEKDFLGKPMLIFFGFTNCPDVCPSGLQTLTVALNALGEQAQKLSPVFVSVDPDRDTPAALAAYIQSFHPLIRGLTGTPDEVQAAAKSYRVYYKKVPDPADATRYNVDHSAFFYLMDKNGQYVKHFPHTVDAEKLAEAIRAIL